MHHFPSLKLGGGLNFSFDLSTIVETLYIAFTSAVCKAFSKLSCHSSAVMTCDKQEGSSPSSSAMEVSNCGPDSGFGSSTSSLSSSSSSSSKSSSGFSTGLCQTQRP